MSNIEADDIQVIEIPEDAVIMTRANALAPESEPEPGYPSGPMGAIMRFRFFVIGLLVVLGIVSAWPLREVFSNVQVLPFPDFGYSDEDNYLLAASNSDVSFEGALPFSDEFLGTPLRD